jgi:hypothetical protein
MNMTVKLSNFELGMCAGGDSYHCVCCKATNDATDYEISTGIVDK